MFNPFLPNVAFLDYYGLLPSHHGNDGSRFYVLFCIFVVVSLEFLDKKIVIIVIMKSVANCKFQHDIWPLFFVEFFTFLCQYLHLYRKKHRVPFEEFDFKIIINLLIIKYKS